MKISDRYSVRPFSSQEDGGGPDPSRPVLSQGFFESATSLDLPDPVCGDVPGYQYFHILQ